MSRRGPNEGSIYQRADGRWVGAAHIGYRDGRRVRRVVYGKTRREASERLGEVRRRAAAGLDVTAGRQTVGQFLTTWLAEVVAPTVRPKTLASYESVVRVHLIPSLGRVDLVRLRPLDVQAMLNAKTRAGRSPQTVKTIRAVLRDALNSAVRWGLVDRNAAGLAEAPSVSRREPTVLSPAQARRFLDSVREDRLGALYAVSLALGLRQGEVLALSWSDIDLDSQLLRVTRTLTRAGPSPTFGEPKTQTSRRTLPLSDLLVGLLRAQRARQLEERLLAGSDWTDMNLVFTTTVGTPLDGPTVTRRFHAALVAAGLPRIRFHDLRHSFASFHLGLGVDSRVVMELLGHSDIRLTQNLYQHVLPEVSRDAAERLEAMLTG